MPTPWYHLLSLAPVVASVPFFAGAVLGLLRFPDVYTRLHALTKADNVGLGLLLVGLAIRADSWWEVAKLGLVWGLLLFTSATACQVLARSALREARQSSGEP